MRTQPYGDMFYGEIARTYDAAREKKPIWTAENIAVEAFLGALPNGSTVLDVPFGNGRFAQMYQRKEMRVSGVEISSEMLTEARAKLGRYYDECDLRCCPALPAPFPDATFDIIVSIRFLSAFVASSEVMPHLKEFRRVCRGSLIIHLNNRTDAPSQWPKDHEMMGYTLIQSDVEAMIVNAGFSVRASVVTEARENREKRVYLAHVR